MTGDVRRGALRGERLQGHYDKQTGLHTGQDLPGAENPPGWRGVQTRVAARLARVGRGRGSIPRLAVCGGGSGSLGRASSHNKPRELVGVSRIEAVRGSEPAGYSDYLVGLRPQGSLRPESFVITTSTTRGSGDSAQASSRRR
jgi:hypothetical protein